MTDAFSNLKKEILSVAAAYVGFNALKSFVVDNIAQAAALNRTSAALDMNAKRLKEWQLVAKHTGSSPEEITNSIRMSNSSIANLRATGTMSGQLEVDSRYGVNLKGVKTGEELLMREADTIKKIKDLKGTTDAVEAMRQMGHSESEYKMFKDGSAGLEKQLVAQAELAEEQAKLADKAQKVTEQWDNVSNKLQAAGVKILEHFMPAIEKMAAYLESSDFKDSMDFFVAEIKFVASTLEAVGKAIKKVYNFFTGNTEAEVPGNRAQLTPGAQKRIDEANNADRVRLTPGAQKRIDAMNGKGSTDKAQYVMKRLIAMGYSPAQAAGITGSLQQESQLDPNSTNAKSGMYGIGQWDTNRRADFKAWAGHDIHGTTLDEQLDFMQYELTKGKEKKAYAKIMAAKTASEAATAHSDNYERAGGDSQYPVNNAARVGNANAVFNSFNSANAAQVGAMPSMAAGIANKGSSTVNNSSSETHIGAINIHTQATDANNIASSIGTSIKNYTSPAITNASTGVA